ncbi:MAG: D-serine ammonia-lyase [Firmicutes bacterium]|nr:D-serine ammonia-lyase [Bacillota bacterium]
MFSKEKIDELIKNHPKLSAIINTEETFWQNPLYNNSDITEIEGLKIDNILDAENRLKRFAPYIAIDFPETAPERGIIESPLKEISNMKISIENLLDMSLEGKLLLKCDSHLPISGSIKARGGIYEVLKHAEDLATKEGILSLNDDYSILAQDKFKNFFSQYKIVVGSTGNLGLSIGIMSAMMGFKVFVHMSADARQWKKDLLRSKGVNVIEYEADYSKAVEEGRKQSEKDPNSYFVDDENSVSLFLGYAVAALRLKKQLKEMNIIVDNNHPLFVYLPCGVGGGPGGVAFGLKLLYGANVHCFFAEPTHAPCMVIGMMTRLHNEVSVQDFDIDNLTEADGLAVGRASRFVGKVMDSILSGIFTVQDDVLYRYLTLLADTENIYIEPSAAAGFPGLKWINSTPEGKKYIESINLIEKMKNSTHIVWATGGSMVPRDVMQSYYKKGR